MEQRREVPELCRAGLPLPLADEAGHCPDIGALFENFIVSERIKFLHYHHLWYNTWFWRTTAMQEIDFIEEGNGQLAAYEFKWNPKRIAKVPKTFTNSYPNATFNVITRDNVEEFLL